ncbi:MAG TPA: heterodisulfide reductase-related iron-sulfur binding cluster [Chloroflexota bacterium]|nr:heterodisulfide reductase-related iron-sulfur binding cluster [Chloroflexota bacterium]
METTGPTIGPPVAVALIWVLTLGAVALFAISARRLVRLLAAGRPENRLDQPGQRLQTLLVDVFGQRRLLERPYSGILHVLIFWGFVVTVLGSAEHLLHGLIPGFLDWPVIGGWGVYRFSQDLFSWLVLVGVVMAVYQRVVMRPPRLSLNLDGMVILGLIALLMVSNLLIFGARIILAPAAADAWMPASQLVARAMLGLPAPAVEALYRVGWWVHVTVLLGFLVYLPQSKHLHIITAAPNSYLRSVKPKGQLPTIDIEKALENDEPVGVSKIEQFTWKDLLDTITCTECGRCQAECPASISGKELSPKYLVLNLKDHLLHDEADRLLGKAPAANGATDHAPKEMVGDVIHDQVLWDCVTCRACMDACPVFIEHVPKIVDMRRHLVMEASRILPEWQKMLDNVEASGNPWRFPRAQRADWAKANGIPTLAERPDAEYLFWVGCAGSYDERNVKVSIALARLLERAGVAFAILGTEETCCGDPVRRVGNEYLFQLQAQQNVETLNGHQVRKIVTACPHCFNTVGTEYRAFGGDYEVVHHVQLLQQLVAEGRLKPEERLDASVAYHDPCYIGRYHDIYDQPREALKAIPGVELREMERHRERAMCCGAGGGHAFCEERTGRRINHIRLEQALDVQPERVATACPYCLMMFEDATRAKDVTETLPVADVAEMLERSTRRSDEL